MIQGCDIIKVLKELHIIFENCDYISIPYTEIKLLFIQGLFQNIVASSNINNKNLKGKLLSDNTYAEQIKIIVFRSKNFHCKYNRDIDFISRIKMHDIVAVDLIYHNNEKETIYCCWDGTDQINNLQHEEINDNNIIITINC